MVSIKTSINTSLLGKERVDNVLHVVAVLSNICEYKKRWKLMNDFIERLSDNEHIRLYIVELAYGNQEFQVTNSKNPQHLQLRTNNALWHKENMINIAIRRLLPPDWKAVAWIDGDIEFDNPNWADDTLKVLTSCDIIQLFSVCFDLDNNNIPMDIWQSFCYKYVHNEPYTIKKNINYSHPGYAWACTRKFYDKIGGLYDKSILGSGDYIITQAILGKTAHINDKLIGFKTELEEYIKSFTDCRVGYIPCNIRHYYHGAKCDRKYSERNQILINYNFNPKEHLVYDVDTGLITPTSSMSKSFLEDILQYFIERKEDNESESNIKNTNNEIIDVFNNDENIVIKVDKKKKRGLFKRMILYVLPFLFQEENKETNEESLKYYIN